MQNAHSIDSASRVSNSDAPERLGAAILTDETALRSELRRRRDRDAYKSIHPADTEAAKLTGWSVHRSGNTSVRVKKAKTHDVWLEDRAWTLVRVMGYPEMNTKGFRIEYSRADGSADSKQIDVFAKDDETVLVIECKSRQSRGRKSLTKDLSETASLQSPIREAIRRVYGRENKLQVIFIYITENIIWSEPDVERADAFNIKIITENEMRYYSKYMSLIGVAGRYQFLAEMLSGKKIPGLDGMRVPAVRGKFGKNVFYSFVAPAKHLLKIAFVNHQSLNHPEGLPAYQRMISSSRLKEIAAFIDGGGYFPTNILINFVSGSRFEPLSKDFNTSDNLRFGWLSLPAAYRSAWIIDGQHRLYSYSKASPKRAEDSIFVLAFDKLDTIDEADLFITINNKQKSVPTAILTSLKADLNWNSKDPKERLDALSSKLIKTLDSDSSSPFFQRFAMDGLENAGEAAVTIAEISKGLVRSNLLGKHLQKSYVPGPLSGATDLETIKRAQRILNGYFEGVRVADEDRWNAGKSGYVLSNPGIRAHLQLFAQCLKHLEHEKDFDAATENEASIVSEVTTLLKPVFDFLSKMSDAQAADNFGKRFGEGGVKDYYFRLATIVHKTRNSFGGEELKTWLAETNVTRKQLADTTVISINSLLTDYVFDTLKRVHGTNEVPGSGDKAYWEIGIENAKIKEDAYSRQQREPLADRKAREVYVDVIELKSIIKQKNNWEHFRDTLNLPLEGEKGKVYYLDWMDDFNKIRRIPAHASSQRVYNETDYGFVAWLNDNLVSRLEAAKSSVV